MDKIKSNFTSFAIPLFIVLGFLIYSNSLCTPFQYDDFYHILNEDRIKDVSIGRVWEYKTPRFITRLTFTFNYYFSKFMVFDYHIINLALHVFSSILVYFLIMLTLKTPKMKGSPFERYNYILALFSGLIFLSHPLQSQAVTYISQRYTLLYAFFYISSIVLYAKARLNRRFPYYFFALVAVIAAFFTKENAITLPFTILLYEYIFFGAQKKDDKKKFVFIVSIFFLAVIAIGLVYNYIYDLPIAYTEKKLIAAFDFITRPNLLMSRKEYFFTELNVLRTYMRLLIFPINQNLDYDYPISRTILEPATILSLLLLTGLIVFAIKLFKRQRLMSFGIFWFFITLSVESSIVPLHNVIDEHRLYLPMVGFVFFITPGLRLVVKNRRRFIILLSALVLIFSFLTYNRNKVWKNGITLWQDAVKKSPNKFRPHLNLAYHYYRSNKYDEAINEYEKAAAIDPVNPKPYSRLGATYIRKGDYDKAIENYKKCISLNPEKAGNVYLGLAVAYHKKGDFDKAIEYSKKAIMSEPSSAKAYFNLGLSYGQKNDPKNAMKQVIKLRELNKNELATRLERLIKRFPK